jgi:IS4 transposase
MQTLFRLFLLKECHGWDHETALVEYLSQHHNFVFACLLYSIWRAVDLLVQVELTGEYEHSPIVTADNTLTLLKKETGIG